MGNILRDALQASTRCSDVGSTAEIDLEELVYAMDRLYQLLEEYAPSWYTEEERESACKALQALHEQLDLSKVVRLNKDPETQQNPRWTKLSP